MSNRHYRDLLRDDADNAGMDKPRSRWQFRGDNSGLIAAVDREAAKLRARDPLKVKWQRAFQQRETKLRFNEWLEQQADIGKAQADWQRELFERKSG